MTYTFTIKINRVARLSRWSRSPATYEAVTKKIPEELWKTCTARQLVAIIEAMQSAYFAGRHDEWVELAGGSDGRTS